jgi:peptidoglycan/xylan/chitin deacetylase (PgdA/CDA1 family)
MKSNFVLSLCSLLLLFFTVTANAEFPAARAYIPGEKLDFTPQSLNGKHEVALTFDDGPDLVRTPKVLDILKKYGFHATFFLIGDKITPETEPVILRAIREGHLIGSHSMHHYDSNLMTEDEFRADFKESIAKVRGVLQMAAQEPGAKPVQNEVYFRFPMGNMGQAKGYHHLNVMKEVSNELFGANCINFVFWSIDPSDGWGMLPPKQLYDNVFADFDGGQQVTIFNNKLSTVNADDNDGVNDGGVLLMHDIHDQSVEALTKIYDEFNRRKIKIVPLNQLPEYHFQHRSCGAKFFALPWEYDGSLDSYRFN